MRHLDVDTRGYPVPCMVYRDLNGLPHFAINEEHKRWACLSDDLCSVCGGKLHRGRWFVGGALSAFHADGAFIDPPMHSECAHYALLVCPYLAAPNYAKEIGPTKASQHPHGKERIFIDTTMIPGRPRGDMFVAIMSTKQTIFSNFNVRPEPPFSSVEFWRHGARLSEEEGYRLVKEAIETWDVKSQAAR